MVDKDIEARAHALWDAAYSASAGEGEDAARAVISQAIQEERDRCAEIVRANADHASGSTWRLLLRSYDEIKEGTRG